MVPGIKRKLEIASDDESNQPAKRDLIALRPQRKRPDVKNNCGHMLLQ
jgi:hypothetical protein